ncbi:hypothetical protein [Nonomuraea sp. B1E8]
MSGFERARIAWERSHQDGEHTPARWPVSDHFFSSGRPATAC